MKNFKKVIVVTAVISALTLTGCTSKETKSFKEYMNNGDYIKAATYYTKHKSLIEVDDLSGMVKSQADSVIEQFKNGKMTLSAATANVQALLSIAPKSAVEELNEKIKLLSMLKISQEQYKLGEESYVAEDYSSAIGCFSNVIEDDPLYSEAQSKMNDAQTKLDELQNEAASQAETEIRQYIGQGKYTEAIEALNDFKIQYPDSEADKSLSNEIEKSMNDEMEKNVASYFADFDFLSAYSYVQNLSYSFDYAFVSDKLNSLEDDFTDYVLAEAEKDANSDNYEAACAIIEIAMQGVGDDNTMLNEAYNEYLKHMPIYLADMEYMSSDGDVSVDSNLVDNTNETHRHSLYVDSWGKKAYYVEYFTNGNYQSFTGICACSYRNRSDSESKYFEVYGDGTLLYTSPTMTSSAVPENFEINISGIKVIKIWYPATDGKNSIATIYDGLLSPKASTE